MFICILVIIPLPSRDDLGMLYVYVLCRDVGSKKPQVLYQAVYHGFSIASRLHYRADIPITIVPKVAA